MFLDERAFLFVVPLARSKSTSESTDKTLLSIDHASLITSGYGGSESDDLPFWR